MKVLIVGTGISGLLAAHTARQAGCEVRLVGQGRRSTFYGAQWLHIEPWGLQLASTDVSYLLQGTADGYREKVYGDEAQFRHVKVSPEEFFGPVKAYDIRQAYNLLWDKCDAADQIVCNIRDGVDFQTMLDQANADLVISTIPAPVICTRNHNFSSKTVWAAGDAPDKDLLCPVRVPANTVLCNGEDSIGWYRASNVFDHCTCEWPYNRCPPLPSLAAVLKPVATDCDCWPDIVKGGRYGLWRKGELSHTIIRRTVAAIQVLA